MKIGILGRFGEGVNLLNGQTVKTKIITEELENRHVKLKKVDCYFRK